jgi:glycogen(starch) synthase
MRILHWNEGWLPLIGGTEVLLQHLTREQHRRGHAVAAICDRPSRALAACEADHGVEIRRLGLCAALRSGDAAALRNTAEEVAAVRNDFRPDIVHLHLNGPSLLFHLLTRQSHAAPVLVTLHTPFDQLALPIALRDRLLAEANGITAVSHALLQDLHEIMPAVRDRSSVVWNAVAEPNEAPEPLPFDPPTLLAVGRLVREKGFDVAIEVFAQLQRQLNGLRLVIVGDGPERAALEQLAATLVPNGAVRFLGWVEPARVASVINQATVVLMTSRWEEPFGLVAVEAAYMARPIVATRVGGLAEIVVDGETGCLVEPDDVAAMAAATAALLRDPQHASYLGKQGRRRAHERFSLDACAARYETHYGNLIENFARSGRASTVVEKALG